MRILSNCNVTFLLTQTSALPISISAEFRNLRWLGQFIEQQSVMGDLLLWAAGNQESKCRLLELRHGEAAT